MKQKLFQVLLWASCLTASPLWAMDVTPLQDEVSSSSKLTRTFTFKGTGQGFAETGEQNDTEIERVFIRKGSSRVPEDLGRMPKLQRLSQFTRLNHVDISLVLKDMSPFFRLLGEKKGAPLTSLTIRTMDLETDEWKTLSLTLPLETLTLENASLGELKTPGFLHLKKLFIVNEPGRTQAGTYSFGGLMTCFKALEELDLKISGGFMLFLPGLAKSLANSSIKKTVLRESALTAADNRTDALKIVGWSTKKTSNSRQLKVVGQDFEEKFYISGEPQNLTLPTVSSSIISAPTRISQGTYGVLEEDGVKLRKKRKWDWSTRGWDLSFN